jgi:hypothetical protein
MEDRTALVILKIDEDIISGTQKILAISRRFFRIAIPARNGPLGGH